MAGLKTLRPQASRNLHGNAPDKCAVALLLVDVINDMEFTGGDKLMRAAYPAAQELAKLKQRAARAGVPCIYANDNFGRWRSDFRSQVLHVRQDGMRGAPLAALLSPSEDDYFVLKARHSAFYETCLALLLEHLAVETLVIGGFATESCVSLSANDGFLRGYDIFVLRDGCAAQTKEVHDAALHQLSRVVHAKTPICRDVSFSRRNGRVSLRVRKHG
jgi:nicotinamidase-related amidase